MPDAPFRPLSPEAVAVFAAKPKPMLVLDRESRIRYVNPTARRAAEDPSDDPTGHVLWERFPEFRDSDFHREYTRVLSDGVAVEFETYREKLDRWLLVEAHPYDDGLVATLRDITPEKRALRDLAIAQRVAKVGSWAWDLVADKLEWSDETFRLLGVSRDATPTVELFRSLIADDDERARFDTTLRAAIDGGHLYDIEVAVNVAGSGRRVLHALGQLLSADTGQTIRMLGTLRDITDERLAADTIRRSEQTMQLAQKAAGLGTFSRNVQTHRSEWSDELYAILGLQPDEVDPTEVDGHPEASFIHPDDRALVLDAWRRTIETGEVLTLRHRLIRRDGTVRTVESSAVAVYDHRGQLDRVVGTVRDITNEVAAAADRIALEAQIQQAQKLESLGILAGGIAHDFNNLLVGMLGNASLALLELSSDSPVLRSVAEIETAAQRAADLTRQLLAYAGKGRFVVEAVDLSRLVREMATLLRTAVSKNAQVTLALAGGLPSVEADVTQMRQVIMNLITNASDALDDGSGLVTITTGTQQLDEDYLSICVQGTNAAPGRFVYVEVRDSGTGMDAETRQRMFDPFFTTKFTGRGLGLAATLGIMRGHSGAIRVYSEVGVGTSFKLLFPAGTRPADLTPVSVAATWRGDGEALVVDDEPSVRAVTAALLRRRGFTVTEASNGEEAVALVRANPGRFRLVMLDLTMPGMGGEGAFREINRFARNVRIVLMSGYNEQEVTRLFVGRGLAAFLQKPFRAAEFDEVVARALNLPPSAS